MPTDATTYTAIGSFTINSSQTEVTFSNIPQIYTDLTLVVSGTHTGSGVAGLYIGAINGDSGGSTFYSRTLLQANGSIVVKRAMIIANEEIANRGLDAHQIIFYHDELDYECSEEVAEEVGQIVADAMKKAGEFYNLNIPLAGEYKIGVDWSVH